MGLPSPLVMSALGAGLLVAAGLVIFFLHIIKLALILGAAGFVLLLCASVAFGYEKMGEDKIRPQLVAMTADKDRAVSANTSLQVDLGKLGEERQACTTSIQSWKDLANRAAVVADAAMHDSAVARGQLATSRQSALEKSKRPAVAGVTCEQIMSEIDADSRTSLVEEQRAIRAILFPGEASPSLKVGK